MDRADGRAPRHRRGASGRAAGGLLARLTAVPLVLLVPAVAALPGGGAGHLGSAAGAAPAHEPDETYQRCVPPRLRLSVDRRWVRVGQPVSVTASVVTRDRTCETGAVTLIMDGTADGTIDAAGRTVSFSTPGLHVVGATVQYTTSAGNVRSAAAQRLPIAVLPAPPAPVINGLEVGTQQGFIEPRWDSIDWRGTPGTITIDVEGVGSTALDGRATTSPPIPIPRNGRQYVVHLTAARDGVSATATAYAYAYDFDGSGQTDLQDVAIVECGPLPPMQTATWEDGDANLDGTVSGRDLPLVLQEAADAGFEGYPCAPVDRPSFLGVTSTTCGGVPCLQVTWLITRYRSIRFAEPPTPGMLRYGSSDPQVHLEVDSVEVDVRAENTRWIFGDGIWTTAFETTVESDTSAPHEIALSFSNPAGSSPRTTRTFVGGCTGTC